MRLIMINAVYGSMSTGRIVKQLTEELKKYGVEPTTVFSLGPGDSEAYRMGSAWDVKIHSLLARIFGDAGYHSKRATRGLLKYLDEQKPDLVHLHNLHGNYVNIPMLFDYLAKRRIPVVVTLHDCWWYTGKCCHYTADGCARWQQGCGSCPRLKKDIPSWFFDRTERMLADKGRAFASLDRYAVIGVSDWITNEAKKSFLSGARIITRIYNWIDTDVFRPVESDIKSEHGLYGKRIVLGVAAGWSDAKGFSAFKALAKLLPEEMRLVLIGGLPEGERAESFISIPVTDSQAELAKWYSAADVFVNLSREESFGKVAAEALACGTPVIAVNSTACPELVGPGCGEVIEDTEPETVLGALKRILANEKEQIGKDCRRFALESFNMENNIRKTYELYESLLKGETGYRA